MELGTFRPLYGLGLGLFLSRRPPKLEALMGEMRPQKGCGPGWGLIAQAGLWCGSRDLPGFGYPAKCDFASGEILADFSHASDSGSPDRSQGPMPAATGKIYLVKRIFNIL